MNEQILEQDRYDQMSRHAQKVLMRIGSSWDMYASPSGSYVWSGAFKTLVDSDEPLTIHAICKSDQGCGRNGVKYAVIPMLKQFELVEVTQGNHTKYKLNELGKEVIAAMVETCSWCCESRICGTCYGVGTTHECGHWDYSGNGGVQLNVNDCKGCNDDGIRFCQNCKGDGICQKCLEDDHG